MNGARLTAGGVHSLQDGDVPATHADVEELAAWTDFRPAMPVPEGIRRFVAWYRDYYRV